MIVRIGTHRDVVVEGSALGHIEGKEFKWAWLNRVQVYQIEILTAEPEDITLVTTKPTHVQILLHSSLRDERYRFIGNLQFIWITDLEPVLRAFHLFITKAALKIQSVRNARNFNQTDELSVSTEASPLAYVQHLKLRHLNNAGIISLCRQLLKIWIVPFE